MNITPLKKTNNKPNICLCKSISPGLIACRIVGLLPIVSVHEQGKCVFKRSYYWLAYSFFIMILYICQVFFSTELLNIFHISEGKSLHGILGSVNDIIYSIYIVVLTFLNAIQFSKFAKTLNRLGPIMKDGIYCASSRKVMLNIHYGVIIVYVLLVLIQYLTIAWLHYSESYESNFDVKILINRLVQNIPFIFYILFSATCSLFISCLVCFEKLTIHALKFTPVHPMKGIDETSNERDFMGIIKYNMCNEDHFLPMNAAKLKPAEVVEYLRILHEDICIIMYEMNNCLNPQILVHTVVELTVLIVHWYAVIIYAAFNFKDPLASTIHFLNCLFVVMHSLGLFVFLRNAQQLRNIVSGEVLYFLSIRLFILIFNYNIPTMNRFY